MEQVQPHAGKRTRARKDGGQEAAIKLKPVKDKIDELVRLHNAAATAGDDYGEAVKAAAEEAGLQAKVVRSFVAARAGDKFEEKHREVQQLEMLFDQVGE